MITRIAILYFERALVRPSKVKAEYARKGEINTEPEFEKPPSFRLLGE